MVPYKYEPALAVIPRTLPLLVLYCHSRKQCHQPHEERTPLLLTKRRIKGHYGNTKLILHLSILQITSFCSYKSTVAGRGRSFMVGRFRSCTIPLLQGGKRIATLQACIRHLQGVQQLTTMALASWIKTPREHRMTQRVSPN